MGTRSIHRIVTFLRGFWGEEPAPWTWSSDLLKTRLDLTSQEALRPVVEAQMAGIGPWSMEVS